MNLPLDPKKELWKWGPTKNRTFYSADFLEGIFSPDLFFKKKYKGHKWSETLSLYHDGFMLFINQLEDLEKDAVEVFKSFILPKKKREIVFQSWKKDLEDLEKQERELDSLDLANLDKEEFIKFWDNFHFYTRNFWTSSTVPELANCGSLSFLKQKLAEYIDDETDLNKAMEILTSPENPSFYQIEEMELFETDDLDKHVQKYFWLKNSYFSTKILEKDFFEKRKLELKTNPRQEFKEHTESIKKTKADVVSKYNLSDEIKDIADAIVAAIEWQDDRKSHIFIYLHYKTLLIKRAAELLEVKMEYLLNFREVEISEFFKDKNINLNQKLEERKNSFYGFHCYEKGVKELDTGDAEKYWSIFTDQKVEEEVKKIKGVVASRGKNSKVVGKVRIVKDPHVVEKLEEGEILVTSMTSPEYVFLMKHSLAVVTDEGGLTSHAAIVSRELKIPCIVGSKIATKVLKDGDEVEVDTDVGVVKILEK
jgi:phosphohistidine swiveling domain-containing protein